MSTVQSAWQTFQSILETVTLYWDRALLVLLALYVLRDFYRGTALISRVLSDSMSPPLAAVKLLLMYVKHPWLFLRREKSKRFRAARLFTEIEILEPAPRAPNRDDYLVRNETTGAYQLGSDWHDARAQWKEDVGARKASVKTITAQQLAQEKVDVFAWVVDLWRWLGRLDAVDRPPHHVQIASFQTLDENRHLIQRYFGVLHAMGEKDNAFISTVKIEWGYLAPIFLITGLINRFKEDDGWKLIIDNYPALTEDDEGYSRDLRELRLFLFNCWLLWGPSIPHCNCSMWNPKHSDLTLQYGYGDENNSVDLIVKEGRSRDFTGALETNLRVKAEAGSPTTLCAAPYNVTGRLKWGPSLDGNEVSDAQRLIQGGTGELQKPLQGRIVLEASWDQCQYREETKLSLYYSAYLWIMFVIVDRATGRLFYEGQPWKNLLAYFEHGNIADASTFQTLKENLVTKVCSSLCEILERPADRERVAIKYACAFDDSNCDSGTVVFPPSDIGERRARLVDILQDYMWRDSSSVVAQSLVAAQQDGRLLLPDPRRGKNANAFSSCHLPEMIEKFYSELRQKKPPRAEHSERP
jgi:hypothetical protein